MDIPTVFKPLAIHIFIKGMVCVHLVACCYIFWESILHSCASVDKDYTFDWNKH